MARLTLVRGLSVLRTQPELGTAADKANAALGGRNDRHRRWLTLGDGLALKDAS